MKALYIATCHLIMSGHSNDNPIKEITGKCLYQNGEYSIYKHCDKAYYLLWKNVIIGEYTGVCKELADGLAEGFYDASLRFNIKNCRESIMEAPKYAKKYNFQIR